MKKLLIATLFASAAMPASAEIRVVLQTWNPAAQPYDGIISVVDRPESVSTLLTSGWDALRGPACDQIKERVTAELTALSHQNGLPKVEVPQEEFTCEIGVAKNTRVDKDGRDLRLFVQAAENRIKLKLKLDSGVPDLYAELPFTIATTIRVGMGDPGKLLTVRSIEPVVKLGTPKLDGATVVGDALLWLADYQGLNLPQRVKRAIEKRFTGVPAADLARVVERINSAIGPLPQRVANAGSLGMWYRDDILVLGYAPNWPVARGPISGSILAGEGELADCSNATITATSIGPGVLIDPITTPPVFRPGQAYTASGVSGAPARRPDLRMACTYRIANAAFGANSTARAPVRGRNTIEAVPQVTPSSQPYRLPANAVNFTMTMAANPSGSYLQSLGGKPQVNDARPGTSIKVMPIDRVTIPNRRPFGVPVAPAKPQVPQ